MPIPSLAFAALQNEIPDAALGTFLLVFLVIFVGFYAFFAFSLQKMAEKTGTDNAWWAWVPILQVLLMLNIAERPLWWIILFLVPIVSIVVFIIVFADICKARDKSPWLAAGMLVPLVNFGVWGYLGFSE